MMSAELEALRDEAMLTSCEAWAIQKRWPLSRGIDRSGPCPKCGGTDRFSIHTKQNIFNCRQCGISGSGVIDLVMKTEDVVFVKACEIITGRSAAAPLDEVHAARLKAKAEQQERQRQADASAYRERSRRDGYAVWARGNSFDEAASKVCWDYLAIRAIDLEHIGHAAFRCLRSLPDLDWTESFTDERGNDGWRTIHVGPAMLAAVQMPDGKFGAVHMTWVDLDAPKGRLALPDLVLDDGKAKPRPTKKVRGTKKGGAIRLLTPTGPKRLVMGEGIETTLTPLCHAFEPETAYWAGVDLGNMSGKAFYHDGRRIEDQPDMDDLECFLPPEWCEELVYLGEGDDASVHSREKCIRGLRRARRLRQIARAARPELTPLSIKYVPPVEAGKDLNSIAMEDVSDEA